MQKKLFCVFLLAITLIGTGLHFSCKQATAASLVDVVNGIPPVEPQGIEWRKSLIESLKPLTPEQRKEKIDQAVPRLNAQLIAHIRAVKKFDCEIKSITYVFGSGTADSVLSGNGQRHNGQFTDQLYAVIKGDKCFGDSIMVFVQCFNGTFVINGLETNQFIGSYAPNFTIEKGYGINRYVDYKTSIWIAEQFGLTLYQSHRWEKGKEISPTKALELESRLDSIPVTVAVEPGDHFDLGTMTLNGVKAKGTKQ